MNTQNRTVNVQHWGQVRYAEAWERQTALFNALVQTKMDNRAREKDGSPPLPTDNHLIFCEHPHIYTLGKSGHDAHLLYPEERLGEIGAEYFRTNRGGDVTYHGPGQVVAYPILDLDNFFTDIHRYLRTLEETVIRTLADFGIQAERYEGYTGVWLDADGPNARKICAMGVKASRWVTMHGFALNVNADLSYFGHIVPCGIQDKAVTSMQRELKRQIELADVRKALTEHFAHCFHARITQPQTA